MKIGIIDYGVGNLGSIFNALKTLSANPIFIQRPEDLRSADGLILPGVGNYSDCFRLISEGRWIDSIKDEVSGSQRPLLGICVGMQMLGDSSSERSRPNDEESRGLGLIPGTVQHLREMGCTLRIPHVGWNSVNSIEQKDGLFRGIPDGTDFYFVHSYGFMPTDQKDILATVNHEIPITAAVHRDNVWGTQFHPEKSSRAGFRLIRNFVATCRC